MKLVVAGNAKEFVAWCISNRISPYSREVLFVSEVSRLRGIDFGYDDVVRFGTFYLRYDINDIEMMIVARARKFNRPKLTRRRTDETEKN